MKFQIPGPIKTLLTSSTFWAGLLAVVAQLLVPGVDPRVLIAAVLAYGAKSLGAKVGNGIVGAGTGVVPSKPETSPPAGGSTE